MALSRKQVAGRSFGPIIQLEEGESVLLVVTDVRAGVGPHKGKVVGCSTLLGTEVSLTGHAILTDKIDRSAMALPAPFLITRAGQAGDAIDYEVEAFLDSVDAIRADKEGKKLIEVTEQTVAAHIESLPPRS